MALWEVSVGSVSHRFVEADTAVEATEQVQADIVRALDLQARRAPRALATKYEGAGPRVRRRLIAAMDGLNPARAVHDSKRQARELAAWTERLESWTTAQLALAPPINPETLRRLLTMLEVDNVERNMQRLRGDESEPSEHWRR